MNLEPSMSVSGDLIIKLNGEMDALGCTEIRPELERIINNERHVHILLDLNHVSFLDSSGIGVIVFLYKRLKARGQDLKLVQVHGQPKELMDLLRIDSAISVNKQTNNNQTSEQKQCGHSA